MIETDLIALLIAAPAVSALVGDRVALTALPEGESRPYIVCQLISGQRAGSLNSTGLNRRARMQISCFSNSYLQAKAIAEVAMDAIENHDGFNVVFNGDQDLMDQTTKLFYTVMDYSITVAPQ